jgi:hypothetical protein
MFVDKYLFLFLLRTAKTNGASLINQKSVRDIPKEEKKEMTYRQVVHLAWCFS